MSTEDQLRWDTQYETLTGAEPPPAFLRDCLASYEASKAPGKALDIACGKGQNALYLAERGFTVTALDISSIALNQGRQRAQEHNLKIDWQQRDLETVALPQSEYDLVINFNYLQRSLIESIKGAVKLTGYVIFETFLIDQAAIGHPKNLDYLLKHNELLDCFRDFRVLRYREGKITDSGTACFRAGIFAQRFAA
jgi:tellurite methyltransferase